MVRLVFWRNWFKTSCFLCYLRFFPPNTQYKHAHCFCLLISHVLSKREGFLLEGSGIPSRYGFVTFWTKGLQIKTTTCRLFDLHRDENSVCSQLSYFSQACEIICSTCLVKKEHQPKFNCGENNFDMFFSCFSSYTLSVVLHYFNCCVVDSLSCLLSNK